MIATVQQKGRPFSDNWTDYFQYNRKHLMTIDWDDDYQLSATEVNTILCSLQQFQLGESSEGLHFLELAKRYVSHSGDAEYLPALQLFIQEEHRHARDLGRFMQQQHLPLASTHWVDSSFRRLRHLADLEISITFLVIAEIVAVTYYKALHDATAATVLRQICRQILRDEVQHLRFQSGILRKIRGSRPLFGMFVTDSLQRILFGGTLLVVWWQHRAVYRGGGFTFGKFWHANWHRFMTTFADS